MGLRDVEQTFKGQRGISLEVDDVRRRVISTSDELVEFLVLFRGNSGRLLHPNGTNGVNLLAVEVNWESDEVGVGLDDV